MRNLLNHPSSLSFFHSKWSPLFFSIHHSSLCTYASISPPHWPTHYHPSPFLSSALLAHTVFILQGWGKKISFCLTVFTTVYVSLRFYVWFSWGKKTMKMLMIKHLSQTWVVMIISNVLNFYSWTNLNVILGNYKPVHLKDTGWDWGHGQWRTTISGEIATHFKNTLWKWDNICQFSIPEFTQQNMPVETNLLVHIKGQ